MADYTLREYRASDIPALSFLWRDVFGDPLPFTAEFYALLPDMGSAVVAEMDGKIVGAAHVLTGFELVGKRQRKGGNPFEKGSFHRIWGIEGQNFSD